MITNYCFFSRAALLLTASLMLCTTSSIAGQSDEDEGFQGWVKTYCNGTQTTEPAVVDYGSCTTDDAYYHVAAPGVRYKTLRIGCGPLAQKGDVAIVEYTGWLFDKNAEYARGHAFDSSYQFERRSFEFTLGQNRVIKGWEFGILGMSIGEVREIIMEPSMAYGDRGAGNIIPPCSTLIFEIELLELREE